MQESVDQLIARAGAHHAAGRLAEAEGAYRAAVAREPGRLDATAGLGIVLGQMGAHAEALRLLPHELVFRTGLPLLLVARGSSLLATGEAEEAIACLQRAVQIDGNSHEAHNTLGCALLAKKRYLEAIMALRNAIRIVPRYAEAFFNLGLTLYAAGMFGEAAEMYGRAAALRAYPQALLNRGFALRKAGDLDGAMGSFQEALTLSPTFDQAMHNLGATLADAGKVHAGIQWVRRAVATNPGNQHAHSALIYLLNFDPEATGEGGEEMVLEQVRWQERHAGGTKHEETKSRKAHEEFSGRRVEGGKRRLRVGYVSPDFRAHAEARFLLPLFENHNRLEFEVHCYSSVENPDDYTERFGKLADHWHEVGHLSDELLAARIREDRIDVLVDLTMHMEGNRLLTFARRPAPVQVCWLAYPGVTGLRAMDYFVTDSVLARGGVDVRVTEKPLVLPGCWFCYQPERSAPPVNPLPALGSSSITFGSLNTFRKMSLAVVELWAEVLRAVAGAQSRSVRLILSCPPGRHRGELLAAFESRGIPPTQIELVGTMPYAEYLATYQRIDIALDPFPHNGATTTLDALHMGVPVLTLKGTTPTGRLGESIMTGVGMAEWVAESREDFVRRAVGLGGDIRALGELRGSLREKLGGSSLTNGGQFAKKFENALRAAWDARRTSESTLQA